MTAPSIKDAEADLITLEMACEDYHGLYEIVWALNTAFPKVAKEEKISVAGRVVDSLIKRGLIEIFEWQWKSSQQRPVPVSAFYAAVNRPETWEPGETFLAFAATEQGKLSDERRRKELLSGASMVAETITIARAELTADASQALIGALNAELSAMYPEPGANHFGLKPAQVSGQSGAFLIVSHNGTPVGCGAVRLIDADTGELKRMYMAPSVRGKGLAKQLVAALEAEARALGARRLVLETGIRQHAALALYRATGFRPIPLYGEYLLSPDTSVCLGKDL
jgi:putative acetyltransferase